VPVDIQGYRCVHWRTLTLPASVCFISAQTFFIANFASAAWWARNCDSLSFAGPLVDIVAEVDALLRTLLFIFLLRSQPSRTSNTSNGYPNRQRNSAQHEQSDDQLAGPNVAP